jgi:hypothetical protein
VHFNKTVKPIFTKTVHSVFSVCRGQRIEISRRCDKYFRLGTILVGSWQSKIGSLQFFLTLSDNTDFLASFPGKSISFNFRHKTVAFISAMVAFAD